MANDANDFMNKAKQTAGDFAESVGKTASAVAEVVGQKVDELYSSAKTKLAIMDAKKEIKARHTLIGELVYASATGGDDNKDLIEQKIFEITELKEKIALLEANAQPSAEEEKSPEADELASDAEIITEETEE